MENEQLEVRGEALSLKRVTDRVNLVHEVLKRVMKKGTHYGTVPGCGDKMVLLKPGADVLAMTFRLVPQFEVITAQLPNDHREFTVTCSMRNPEGVLLGQGVGSASTMEKKYRYRYEGGEWDAAQHKKVGATKIENEDIADVYNTVLKIAKKRSHIDATLTVTGAADLFTQDLIDEDDTQGKGRPPVTMPTEVKDEPAQGNTKTVTGVVGAVSVKTSKEGAPKPWKKTGIKIGENWYATFDEKTGSVAGKGRTVTIVYKTNEKGYHDIVAMQPANPPGDVPDAADPTTIEQISIFWQEQELSEGKLITLLRKDKLLGEFDGLEKLAENKQAEVLAKIGVYASRAGKTK